jgi:YD repeat-containing protein
VGAIEILNRLGLDATHVSYSYDAAGNMTAMTVPAGATHTFEYGPFSERERYGTPISGSYTYTYDGERNLKSVTLPSGRQITGTYTHGFLTAITAPEGVTTLARGRCGRLNSATRDGQTVSYAYDGTLITADARHGAIEATIAYACNSDFRPRAVSYANATQTLSYDPDGLLVGSGPFTITRSADSGLATAVLGGPLAVSRTFSGYGELDASSYSVGSSPALSWTLTRDKSGRIITKTETSPTGSATYSYTYDPMGRLATVTKDGALAEAYSYDAAGNRAGPFD